MTDKCDICEQKTYCRKFTRKELVSTETTKKLFNGNTTKYLYPEFKELEEKHGFNRKTKICKKCLDKFPKLN